MYDPVTIKVKAATLTIDTVAQFHVEVTDRDKPDKLADVLKAESPTQAIIFARTKIGVDRLARRLGDKGLRVKTLHGDMSQGARDGVMIAFKGGRERLLVATDVAARGLDIAGVSHIVNYDIPNSPDIYVHRIGRTGRAGDTGRAITFITPKQRAATSQADRAPRRQAPEIPALGRRTGALPEPPPRAASRAQPRAAAPAAATRSRGARLDAPVAKIIIGAGRTQGFEPADVVGAIVDHSHLDGEDVRNVRVLERFSSWRCRPSARAR